MARSFKAAKIPLLTLVLAAVILLAYFFETEATCYAYGLVPSKLEPSAFVTSLFLHDPNELTHIGGNVIFLLALGFIVERALGAWSFLALYVAAGLGGGILHCLVSPAAAEPLVGCSGALFGILAVASVMRPKLLWSVVPYVGMNIWGALNGGPGSVSFGCHLGGFVVGFVVVACMRLAGSEALEAT